MVILETSLGFGDNGRRLEMGLDPLGVHTTKKVNLLTSYHLLETDVKERRGIYTF